MSTFQVRLVPTTRSTGVAADPAVVSGESIQKTMWVTGPNLTFRKLYDGETFDSTNYWKRFAPVSEGGAWVDTETAFIHIVTDDGSPWSDTNPCCNRFPRVVDLVVAAGTCWTLAANQIDVLGDYGGVALFTQIVTDRAIKVRLNGSSSADLDLPVGSQTFDNCDLPITSLAFCNNESGALDATVQVLLAIEIQSLD